MTTLLLASPDTKTQVDEALKPAREVEGSHVAHRGTDVACDEIFVTLKQRVCQLSLPGHIDCTHVICHSKRWCHGQGHIVWLLCFLSSPLAKHSINAC